MYQLKISDYFGIKNILYMRMVNLYHLEIRKKDIVSKVSFEVIGKL